MPSRGLRRAPVGRRRGPHPDCRPALLGARRLQEGLRRRARAGGGHGLRGRRVRRLLHVRGKAADLRNETQGAEPEGRRHAHRPGRRCGATRSRRTIDFHQAIGCRFLVVPGNGAFTDPEKSKALADTFNEIAATLKPLGMACGYHNHTNEFKKDGDKTYWDLFAERTTQGRHPAAGLRVDVCGRATTRSAYIRKYPGRTRTMHFKPTVREGRHRQEGDPRAGLGGLAGRLRGVRLGRRHRVDRGRAGDLPRRQVTDGLHAGIAGGAETPSGRRLRVVTARHSA